MRRALGGTAAAWAVLLGAWAADAQALECDSAGSGTFEAAATWTCGVVPDGDDVVEIDAGHVVTANAAHVVQALHLDGGTLRTPGAGTLVGTVGTLSGSGVLSGPGQFVAQSLVKAGVGTLTLTGGQRLSLSAGGSITGGTICIDSPSPGQASRLSIGGSLLVQSGASTAAISCGGTVPTVPDVRVLSNGALVAQRTGATDVQASVQNDGLVRANGGASVTLARGSAGAFSTGRTQALAGARVALRGGHRLGDTSELSGEGTLELAEGQVHMGPGAQVRPGILELTGATVEIQGDGPLAPGVLRLIAGQLTTTRIASPPVADLRQGTLGGTGRLRATDLSKTTAGTVVVERGFAVDILDQVTMAGRFCLQPAGGGNPLLTVLGELVVGAAAAEAALDCGAGASAPLVRVDTGGRLIAQRAGQTVVTPPIAVDGVLQAAGGDVRLTGGGTSFGRVEAQAGRTVVLGGAHQLEGDGAGDGLAGTGTVEVQGTLALGGPAAVTVGTLRLPSGTASVSGPGAFTPGRVALAGGELVLNRTGTAALEATTGRLAGTGALQASPLQKTGPGALTLGDGAQLRLGGPGTVVEGSICPQGSSRLVVNGAAAIPGQALPCSTGGVRVDPAGTLAFTSNGTVQTPVAVAGGTLDLDRDLAFTAGLTQTAGSTRVRVGRSVSAITFPASGGDVLVQGALAGTLTLTGGAVLRGTGQAGVVQNAGGVVRPGASPGVLTVQGPYTQGPAGTLEVEVDGTAPGTGFDRLVVLGSASLGGTLAVVRAPGFTPADSDTFPFLAAGTRSGTFAQLTGGALAAGRSFRVDASSDGARLAVELPPAPVNTAAPTITGDGGALTCNPGTWSGSPSFAFAWTRDAIAITGATQAAYTPVDADRGTELRCVVTATNAGGSAAATSAPRAIPAPPAPPTPQTPPTVTSADTGTVTTTDTTPLPPPPPPVPTARELALAKAKPDVVGKAFGLPATRRCQSLRRFDLRLAAPANVHVSSVTATVAGKRAKVVRRRGRFVVTIDLRGRRASRVKVAFVVRTTSGRTLRGARTYRTCGR